MADAQSIAKTLSKESLDVIASFVGVPYYNNKHKQVRMGLRALVGKGSPDEIAEETLLYSLREKVDFKSLLPEMKKKFLVEHNLGIDCSGLAYYILDAESAARGKSHLRRLLSYPFANSLLSRFGRLIRSRYSENASTRTFAHESNSHEVALLDVAPADFIVMLESGTNGQVNHILIITQVVSIENVPNEINYIHSIAWPADGRFDHGIREGKIAIKNINHPLLDQTWLEAGKTGPENFTYHKAGLAKSLSLRRLNWF